MPELEALNTCEIVQPSPSFDVQFWDGVPTTKFISCAREYSSLQGLISAAISLRIAMGPTPCHFFNPYLMPSQTEDGIHLKLDFSLG